MGCTDARGNRPAIAALGRSSMSDGYTPVWHELHRSARSRLQAICCIGHRAGFGRHAEKHHVPVRIGLPSLRCAKTTCGSNISDSRPNRIYRSTPESPRSSPARAAICPDGRKRHIDPQFEYGPNIGRIRLRGGVLAGNQKRGRPYSSHRWRLGWSAPFSTIVYLPNTWQSCRRLRLLVDYVSAGA